MTILNLYTSHSWAPHAVIQYASWEIVECRKNCSNPRADAFLRRISCAYTESKSNFEYVLSTYNCFKICSYFKKQSFQPILNHSGTINGCTSPWKGFEVELFQSFSAIFISLLKLMQPISVDLSQNSETDSHFWWHKW